ncbi:MAG: hypothetical protein GY716_00480 [bacterium]|nr:hypothetical protein [bacterium]
MTGCTLALFLALTAPAAVEPELPVAGGEVLVVYDPRIEGARFTFAHIPTAVANWSGPAGTMREHRRMRISGRRFELRLEAPGDATRLELQFVGVDHWDPDAALDVALRPAEGDGARTIEVLEFAADEAGYREWIERQPHHPLPRLRLARLLLAQNRSYDEAAAMALGGVERILAGELRMHGDPGGGTEPDLLFEAYHVAADATMRAGDGVEALTLVLAAQALPRLGTDFAETSLLEGRIQERLGRFAAAERAYADALRGGSDEAEPLLRNVQRLRHGKELGSDTPGDQRRKPSRD